MPDQALAVFLPLPSCFPTQRPLDLDRHPQDAPKALTMLMMPVSGTGGAADAYDAGLSGADGSRSGLLMLMVLACLGLTGRDLGC